MPAADRRVRDPPLTTRARSPTSISTCSSTTRTRTRTNWVNEGLVRLGADPHRLRRPGAPDHRPDFGSHVQSFLRLLRHPHAGQSQPGDGGPGELAEPLGGPGAPTRSCADYGGAYAIMEILNGRYGPCFMTALHREDANGFAGLPRHCRPPARATRRARSCTTGSPRWPLDGVLDRRRVARRARGLAAADGHARRHGQLEHRRGVQHAGAPPNGADYVRLRNRAGAFLRAADLRSLAFDGAATLAPTPVEWTVDAAPGASRAIRRCTRAPATTSTGASCATSRCRPQSPR